MDPGLRSPLIDFFRRGEVARDVRLLAAQGTLAPRALEQLALLVLLSDDPDPAVAAAAGATIDRLPDVALRGFLARSDVPGAIREFFAARGIESAQQAAPDTDTPLVQTDEGETVAPEVAAEGEQAQGDEAEEPARLLSSLPIVERMKLAMMGTRAQRVQLIRDANKLVSAAVLSSPKLTEPEVEAFAKIATLPEEILRAISMNKVWMKNYGVAAGLTRNPKTPLAIAMQLLQRLNDRDMRALSMDRNVQEALRVAARRYVVKSGH